MSKKISNNTQHFIEKNHKVIMTFLPVLLGFCAYAFFSFVYYDRVTSFLFFDEYANIIAGFFMKQGRMLYSENFFNHQMFPAYISYFLQTVTTPDSLYQLISYHRLLIICISLVFGLCLIWRTRYVGLIVLCIYESIKFYVFGNLFLAESFIVYPLFYLFYISWERLQKRTLLTYDYWFAALSAFLVIFSREPYVPLAILFMLVIFGEKKFFIAKEKRMALLFFFLLSGITLFTVSLPDYLSQVVLLNYQTVFQDQLRRSSGSGLGFPAMVFYPLYVFFIGEMSFMRLVLMLISSVLLVSGGIVLYIKRHVLSIVFIIMTLTLANIRVIKPGVEFYSAFYQIQWIVLTLTASVLLIKELFTYKKKIALSLLFIFILVFISLISTNTTYFMFQNINKQQEFTENYDGFYVVGQAIQMMKQDNSTLFVDLSDSLVYWTGGIPSSYPLGVYYPVEHDLLLYRKERLTMFYKNPPDFYYTNCNEGIKLFYSLPVAVTQSYAPVLFEDNPSCLFVKKTLAHKLSVSQLAELSSLGFSIKPEFLKSQ